jgi:hypothetical protein
LKILQRRANLPCILVAVFRPFLQAASDDRSQTGGQPSGRQLVEHDAQRPNVTACNRRFSLQHLGRHADGDTEAGARVVGGQLPRPPQQMRQTRLMERAVKAPIRRPPIADDDAREAPAEQPRCLRIAAASLDAVDRRVRRRHRPQPVQPSGNFPPGFIGGYNGTAANLLAQGGIGRARLPGGPVSRVHQSAARDRQPVLLLKQRGDLSEREPELLIEDDGERDCLRAELHTGRAQGVGGLQRMAPLHAAPTCLTAADGHAKRTDEDAGLWKFFLILHRHAGLPHGPATPRTLTRQLRLVVFVDPPRSTAVSLHAIAAPRFPSRATWVRHGWFSEWRSLSVRRTAGFIELALQPLVSMTQLIVITLETVMLALQALTVVFELLALTTQRITLPFGAFDAFAEFIDLGPMLIVVFAPGRVWHIDVMPEARKRYKYEILD